MISITQLKSKIRQVALLIFFVMLGTAALGQILPAHASAATITVAGLCTLDDAVASVNAASNQSGCTGSGAYGSNDIILLPVGTFPYSDTAEIAASVTIQGAGRNQSIIDADGNNGGLRFSNTDSFAKSAVVKDLAIINANTSVQGLAFIYAIDFSLSVNNVEMYSDSGGYSTESVIHSLSAQIDGLTRDINNVYIHDVSTQEPTINLYVVDGANSTNNVVRNTAIEDATVSLGAAIAFGTYDDGGTFSGDAYNNTIEDMTVGSGGVLFATSQSTGSGNGVVNASFRNITTRLSTAGSTGSIVAVSVAVSGRTATVNMVLQNNLLINGACGGYTFGAGGTEDINITSLGGNIASEAGCSTYLTEPSDQTGIAAATLNAKLGPLQNNGGINPTIALLAGSEAIDSGVANSLTADQRGQTRPQGAGVDTGAYELAVAAPVSSVDSGASLISPQAMLASTGQSQPAIIGSIALLTLLAVLAIAFGRHYRNIRA